MLPRAHECNNFKPVREEFLNWTCCLCICMKRAINTTPFHLSEQNEKLNNQFTFSAFPNCVRVGCAHTQRSMQLALHAFLNRFYHHRDIVGSLYVIWKEFQFKSTTLHVWVYIHLKAPLFHLLTEKRTRISASREIKRLFVCFGSGESAYLFLTASDPVSMYLALGELLGTLKSMCVRIKKEKRGQILTQSLCFINNLKCRGKNRPYLCRNY